MCCILVESRKDNIEFAIIMAALRSRWGHYLLALFLSFFFSVFSSPNLNGRRPDVYDTCTHCVALV